MMHLVLLMLFVFAKYQGSMTAHCKDGWTYYQQDESCLRQHTRYETWINSRVDCKQDGGDIVEIQTKDKENFAVGVRTSDNLRIWTGVSDLNQDGTFEYINGTELVENARPLGSKWESLGPSPGTKKCVVITKQKYGLKHEDCSIERYPICEIRLQPGPTTVVGLPPCKSSMWTKIGQKFLYFHRKLADFSTASKYCSEYGGKLLRPSSAEESESIKERGSLWKPGSWFFWIGVKQIKVNVWAWDGGEPLADGEYSKWSKLTPETSAELCVAIVWADSSVWHKIACKTLNFFICEASSPCPTTVFMAINGVKQLENNAVVDSQYNKSVLIECFQEGTGPDTQISINCPSVPEKKEGSRRVNMYLPKKYRKSGPNCTCTFVYKDGTREIFGITFKGFKYNDGDDDANNAKGVFSWLLLLLAILLVLLLVGGSTILGGKKQNEDEGGYNNEAEENKEHADNDKAIENEEHEDARSNVTKSDLMEPGANRAGSVESEEINKVLRCVRHEINKVLRCVRHEIRKAPSCVWHEIQRVIVCLT